MTIEKKAAWWMSLILAFLITPLLTVAMPQHDSLKHGVVSIINKKNNLKGSGFIFRIDSERKEIYIVTAAHLISGNKKPMVEFYTEQDRPVEGIVKLLNEELDLAVIVVSINKRVPENVIALNIVPSAPLIGGDDVVVIGSPRLGAPWSIIKGSVEAVQGGEVLFSGNIGEGISGSPLLKDNQVVGLVRTGGDISKAHPAGAVTADIILAFIRSYLPNDQIGVFRHLNVIEFTSGLKRIIEASYENFESIKGPLIKLEEKFQSFRYLYASMVSLPGLESKGILRESIPGGTNPNPVLEYRFHKLAQEPEKVEQLYKEIISAVKTVVPKDWVLNDYEGPKEAMTGGLLLVRGFTAKAGKNGPSVEAKYVTDDDTSHKPLFVYISLIFTATTKTSNAAANPNSLEAIGIQVDMDLAYDASMKMRMGIRSGLRTLAALKKFSTSEVVRQRTKALYESIATDYENVVRKEYQESNAKNALEALEWFDLGELRKQPTLIPGLVKVIRTDEDLKRVAFAFLALAEATGQKFSVFDLEAVDHWCTSHPSTCKN